jgi:Second Messenger Oligonucleotide or Dinucleotide Synthetase domain
MTNVPDAFKTFHSKIELAKAQEDRIDAAWATLVRRLVEHYELEDGDVFLQGSYPNGTAIRPDPERDDGEYDVDLVCVAVRSDATPEEAIKELEDALDQLGYGDRFERDSTRPCVRLRYADDPSGEKLHVDVIPARPCATAALEVPRPGNGWHDTDPAAYTQWCQDLGDPFARTVQMLKRWRDRHQGARKAIKSIVLQVLIAHCLDTSAQDGNRIRATLQNLASMLAEHQQPPRVENPVLASENLAERWEQSDYDDFKRCLSEALQIANEAMDALSESESRNKWRELFGKDFPASGDDRRLPIPPTPAPGTTKVPQEAPQRNEWA